MLYLSNPPGISDATRRRLLQGLTALNQERREATGDEEIDVQDLVAVILAWNKPGGPADINQDGVVDVQDLVEVVLNWGPCA